MSKFPLAFRGRLNRHSRLEQRSLNKLGSVIDVIAVDIAKRVDLGSADPGD
jgi:hypothetical protein